MTKKIKRLAPEAIEGILRIFQPSVCVKLPAPLNFEKGPAVGTEGYVDSTMDDGTVIVVWDDGTTSHVKCGMGDKLELGGEGHCSCYPWDDRYLELRAEYLARQRSTYVHAW